MDTNHPDNELALSAPRLTVWAERLRASGLEGLAGALLDAALPLAPLGAQLLYVAQPVLSVVVARDTIGELARALDDPARVAQLREELGLDFETGTDEPRR